MQFFSYIEELLLLLGTECSWSGYVRTNSDEVGLKPSSRFIWITKRVPYSVKRENWVDFTLATIPYECLQQHLAEVPLSQNEGTKLCIENTRRAKQPGRTSLSMKLMPHSFSPTVRFP